MSECSRIDTRRTLSANDCVMLSGRFVQGANGEAHIVVMFDALAIERKLLIRQLNNLIEGRLPVSNTTTHWEQPA